MRVARRRPFIRLRRKVTVGGNVARGERRRRRRRRASTACNSSPLRPLASARSPSPLDRCELADANAAVLWQLTTSPVTTPVSVKMVSVAPSSRRYACRRRHVAVTVARADRRRRRRRRARQRVVPAAAPARVSPLTVTSCPNARDRRRKRRRPGDRSPHSRRRSQSALQW